ncbi:uncharacterized protein LOC131950384 [Physella acuta]|uniref:uncharacterized protein LOC131950384 n=1 Tax=Physella acuta TaxID=109671 RepID=UPI0027DB4BC2|nr:uncharacterized protein LOC131950384 [Physella acuta]
MKRHALLWFSLVFCGIAFKPYVYCGPCSGIGDCVATDSTSATCDATTKQCTCNAGFEPIRTGCGVKLTKPTVNIEGERGPYLFTGTTGNLSCSTTPGAVSYNWYQGDAKVGSSQTLTISAAGAYTCQAISDTTSLNSDVSDPVNVAVIGGGTSDTAYQGTLSLGFTPSGSSIFTGNYVTLFCMGVPMGYTGSVIIRTAAGGGLTNSDKSSLSVEFPISVRFSGIYCTLETTNKVTFANSPNNNSLPIPNNAIVLSSATLSAKDSNGDIATATTYNVGAVGPTLTCTTDPVPEFLDSSKPIQYEFKDGSTSKNISTSNTYTVDTSKASSGSYLCTATYNGISKTSATLSIDVSTNYLSDPVLTKVSTPNLTIGSTLVLSCGATKGDSTTSYIWEINDTKIAGQVDWKIQLYNFTEADIGVYKCRAVKNRYTTDISSFHATKIKSLYTMS